MPTTELLWFKISAIIVSIATIAVCIPNLIYFNKLRNSTCKEISTGAATTMFWLNLILLIMAVIVMVLGLIAIIVHEKCPCDRIKSRLPPGTTHIAYTHTGHHGIVPGGIVPGGTHTILPTGQSVILPPGPVMGEATSTYATANVLAPNQANTLAQQVQYF